MARRGFGDEIIAKFRLGYAPSNNGLAESQLASKGLTEQEMHELGLIAIPERQNRRSHDFFRDRGDDPDYGQAGQGYRLRRAYYGNGQPKYLNSPETPVFNKRRVLYNLNHARDAAFQVKRLIICEGYMDVIGMDNYGIHYAVRRRWERL
ncbi:MAG: hypothetical protein ACLU99_08515 [Alphaproteobacteria bacterium]